tara:strand:- start:53509 stop:53874 length:366 start_codon:yes stop_codon:yes gene_type:complete
MDKLKLLWKKAGFANIGLALLLFVPLLGMAQEETIEFSSAASVLTWLMPLITLGVTWLVKKILPFVTGTVTLIAVPLITTGLAYLGTIASDSNFIVLFLGGLGSVFLNQLYREITKTNTTL